MAKRTNNTSSNVSLADVRRLVNQAVSQKAKGPRGANSPRSRVSSSVNAFAASAQGPTTGSGGGPGAITVSNTEFITDITTGEQSIQGFDINPVSGSFFTWLSRIASGYELFRFEALEVIYTPMCSSSTAGVIVMAFDYDASDIAPQSKQLISAYQGSARGNVWAPARMKMQSMPGWFYNGQSAGTTNPSGTDVKFYVPARFYIGAFNGNFVTVPAGELSVKYTVRLAKPDFAALPPISGLISYFTVPDFADMVKGAVMSGNIPLTILANGSGSYTITFKTAGQFLLEQVSALTSPAAQSNGWAAPVQTDPNSAPVTVAAADYIQGPWVNAATLFSGIHLYSVSVVAGSVIKFSVIAAVTGGLLSRFRVAPYLKSLG